ncbi:MAG: tRNA (adenosine(37)-N6)-threonylcarbamoyltransferase complex transferase subunit TsaD [Desulfovibrio sp.]|nr:MAG: tRNA (adenosine(37)-N6)-threonylcarbamoyltransferase complex transferase subunit TsaD [Desulfovibrio sp.]
MLCLGIESSCDETGLALVEDGRLLAEVMAVQDDLHAVFGGVVPEIASREHYRVLGPLFEHLLETSGRKIEDIDVVAVARGPGLLGSLLTGLAFAKGLVLGAGADLVGVDHLHAHLLAPGLEQGLVFPSLGVLVSGGHTNLYLIHSPTSFERLGRTLDDAAGEAFDKVAKMLNLPYPGGKHIDALAREAEPDTNLFPRPYLDNSNLDFSFSGLKTAVSQYLDSHPRLRLAAMPEDSDLGTVAHPDLPGVCASLNHAVADTLRVKVERALKHAARQGVRVQGLILAGGVAANTMIRQYMARTAEKHGLKFQAPGPKLCTDNGAMVAYAGYLFAQAGLVHDLRLEAIPRGKPVPWDFVARK